MGKPTDDPGRLESLVAIMDRLRGPDGCPWDLEQDYRSLRRYLLEECYEVAEAIDLNQTDDLCEELGDLMLQIVFLSRIAKEQGHFTIHDVLRGINEKMIRRHPHIFGEEKADSTAEVLENWEKIKRREKGGETKQGGSVLDGVPSSLPAMLKAHSLGVKAARVGFDWDVPEDVMVKLEEELAELRQALDGGGKEEIRGELGDLMFSVIMLARQLEIDPEGALELTNRKFRSRFGRVEQELRRQGLEPEEAEVEAMEKLWNQAKADERS